MAHPYKTAAHKNDPNWVKRVRSENLNPDVEKANKADVDASIRNYGGDKAATMKAARYGRAKSED